eukprot:COSAG02_NODE_7167_length_3141_cov_3.358317_4_plen_70_part_00
MDAEAITGVLAQGGAEEREEAYVAIEGAIRTPSGGVDPAVALVKACVEPLIHHVLCAPASKIDEAEYVR